MATIDLNTVTNLPNTPFDGQSYIDGYRVKWVWDSKLQIWTKIGPVEVYPLATETTSGLLSARHKALLDSLPVAAGGFNIITNPQLISLNNEGMVSGDIKIVSESLDFIPVFGNGQIIENIAPGSLIPDSTSLPGFSVKLSDKFLQTLCFEIAGGKGARGKDGPKGKKGEDGFNDGPKGEQGDPGQDGGIPYKLSGIKIIESDEIVDTAAIALEIQAQEGILTYTKSKLAVPDDDVPADQVIATPLIRALYYPETIDVDNITRATNLLEWELRKPDNDNFGSTELLLFKLPRGYQANEATNYENVLLSDYVRLITTYFLNILCDWEIEWLKEVKEFIESRDEAARSILGNLAQQVSECEFSAPLEFCLSFEPSDCIPPRVTTTALVEAQHFGDTNQVGPLSFKSQADDTGIFTNWRTWPGPDSNGDKQWDMFMTTPSP